MRYRKLDKTEITEALFRAFRRHQIVTRCWRKRDGEWTVVENPFVEDWGEREMPILCYCLRRTLDGGGTVFGAFVDGALKGFASVEGAFFGSEGQYLELSALHVSEDQRGRGMGRALMDRAKAWARANGAKKLYISAHSAVETQAFYRAMGCVEAAEYSRPHVEKEPFDCQLEILL